jgi:NAD(P)H dehydrogenase (quinone)
MLFPIQHRVLFISRYGRLAAVHDLSGRSPERRAVAVCRRGVQGAAGRLVHRRPIPFRRQNGGRYDTHQVLKPGLGHGASGTRIHLVKPGEPEQLPVEMKALKTEDL